MHIGLIKLFSYNFVQVEFVLAHGYTFLAFATQVEFVFAMGLPSWPIFFCFVYIPLESRTLVIGSTLVIEATLIIGATLVSGADRHL